MSEPYSPGMGQKQTRRRPSLKADEAQAIREEVDAALVVIARKHFLTVGYLLRLAALGGSAQA